MLHFCIKMLYGHKLRLVIIQSRRVRVGGRPDMTSVCNRVKKVFSSRKRELTINMIIAGAIGERDVTFGRTLIRNVVLTFVSVSLRDLTKTLEKKDSCLLMLRNKNLSWDLHPFFLNCGPFYIVCAAICYNVVVVLFHKMLFILTAVIYFFYSFLSEIVVCSIFCEALFYYRNISIKNSLYFFPCKTV